ncbi:MAG TPA: nuclear transport factor 2 family protein [Burkholderiales bacterium]|jgi:ketosteroid isomerase-like protein|nr:nuclear transport factor 2 family protein [Burkholderiales bacterium]
MRSGLALLAALALSACAPDSSTVDPEVQKLVQSYITSTDINASLSMLDQTAKVTSITAEGRIVRGTDSIRDEANKQIALMPQLRTTVGAIETTRLGDAHVLAIAPFRISATATPQVEMANGAATLLLAKRDSGWKVVHEHFSYAKRR